MHCAAYAGRLPEMKLLLDSDPGLAAYSDGEARHSPLHAAALGAQPAAARLLLGLALLAAAAAAAAAVAAVVPAAAAGAAASGAGQRRVRGRPERAGPRRWT